VPRLHVRVFGQSGVLQWQHDYGDNTRAESLAFDPSGNLIVAGSQNGELLVLKYSTDGTLLWDKTIAESDEAAGVATDGNSNVYVLSANGVVIKLAP
jgi:outer membrane protein assembly factor BamB